MKRVFGARLAAAAVLLLFVAGIYAPAAKAQNVPAGKSVLTVGSTSDMLTPNPFKAGSGGLDYEVLDMNYDLLFNFTLKDLQPTSGLAQFPPQQSADGKTWTFHIRDDVKWQDGQPLTAEDIAFTYNFIWHNHMAAFLNYLGDPESFTAPNPTTFVWKMKTPTLSPLTPPYVPILPEHIWAKLDGKDANTIKEFEPVPQVGSGPFQLTGWKEGQYVVMKANPDYWGGAPHMDEVIFKTYDTPEALALALQTGEVDFADSLTPNLFDKLKSTPNVATNIAAPATFDNLAFNFEGTANPALKNEQVRLAISYAIDRQSLVDRVWLGYASVGDSVVMPTYKRWYQAPTAGTVQSYDPAKAKQLLDAAGYTDSNGDGVREMPDGSPFTLQLLAISDFDQSVAESNLIAGWLKNVGIDASVKVVNTAKAYDLWGSQNFDAYVWGWTGDPDPDFILSIFTTKQCLEWSDGCYSDPAYDTMYQQQHSATDINARTAEVQKMEQYLYEKNPEIVLLYEQDLQAYRTDRWTGYIVQPQPQGYLLFQWGTYSYLNIRPVAQGVTASSANGGGSPSSGVPAYVWIVLAAVIILVALFFVRRRRKSEENVE